MASITFSPAGTQLDNDEIADIQVEPGDRFSTSFELDTSSLDANLQSFTVATNQDLAEVDITSVRTDFDETTFPNINLIETSTNENFSTAVFERSGSVGAEPDTINIIIEGEAIALDGLTNDGQPDLGGISVTQATDVNGRDVTNLFEPDEQGIDLQSLPTVSIEIKPTLVVEGGESQAFTFKLTEPAPPGGLVVEVLITNPDGEVDIVPSSEPMQNVTDARSRIEDGRRIDQLTVAEGATEASLNFSALEDDLVEGIESFSLTLLAKDGYIVDANNNIANSVIADADIVIDGTKNADVLHGTENVDAISADEGDDIIFANDGNDALFGGDGRDRLFGDMGDDSLFGDDGNDVISGGQGDDLLLGGDGNDALFGDEGHDTFVFASGEGVDIILDFKSGEDAIALTTGSGYDSLAIEYNARGNYTNISDETGELITSLIGVEADQLTESDFTNI